MTTAQIERLGARGLENPVKIGLVASFAALMLAACASDKAAAAPSAPATTTAAAAKTGPAPVEVNKTGKPGQAYATHRDSEKAVVKDVDVKTRMVTLLQLDGSTVTFKAGPEVKRLAEISPGDSVIVEFEQQLLLEYQDPSSPDVAPVAATAGARAGASEAPGAAVAAGIQSTVNVTAVDVPNRVVTFQGPGGNVYKVKAGPGIAVEKLKAGDRLLATYMETLAISLEKLVGK